MKHWLKKELEQRKEIHLSCILTIAGALLVLWIMMTLQPYLISSNHVLDSFSDIARGTAQADIWSFAQWYLGEWAEPQVFRIVPAGILSCLTAMIGYHFERKDSKWRGSDIVGGSGLFIPIFFMSILSLLLCDLIYYQDAQYGFMPTMVPMACVVVAVTLEYGCNWKKFITVVCFTGTIPYFIARYAVFYLMEPFQLPRPVGGWIGMILGTGIAWKLMEILPWMTKRQMEEKEHSAERGTISDRRLYFERLLADPSELICWGSSWNSIGMYAGGIIGWAMNPYSSSCKENWVPVIMVAQVITVAIGNYIYFPYVKEKQMPYVFTGYVPISCFINYYVESVEWIVISILICAVFPPIMTKWLEMKLRVLKKWPIAITCLTSMSLFTIGWSLVIQKFGY